ncbi:MAG: UvrD-helicase domain-containing protein [Candidatus Omnitrophica bacterium]|nr:UvrD-helicase domain-containing protein [Candidatus Omnitrophota bacterium]
MKLTKTQEKAVKSTGGNVLVSAGAGTGKTTVLVERFLHFVVSGEALATEILTVTFTEKAANEMKARIRRRLSEIGLESARRDLESAYISTLHAFAARLLREHPIEAGVDPDFRVIESEESDFLKEQALDETMEAACQKGNDIFTLVRIYGEETLRRGLLHVFDTARHEGLFLKTFFENSKEQSSSVNEAGLRQKIADLLKRLEAEEDPSGWELFGSEGDWDWGKIEEFKEWMRPFSRRGGKKAKHLWKELLEYSRTLLSLKIEIKSKPWKEKFEALAFIFEERYEAKKREKGFLDFDDLQIKAVGLFSNPARANQKLRERYQAKFRQILVDEFQDTNSLQVRFVELLSRGNNLFFVGDYKQSIYAFRGAEPEIFLDKNERCRKKEEGERVSLNENFRSYPKVIDFVNQFFGKLWQDDSFLFEPLVTGTQEKKEDGAGIEILKVEAKEDELMERARMREADEIADRILELQEAGVSFGGIAILFQAMSDVGIYEQALKRKGIPYYALSSRGFYHQHEIRDMMSFLAFLENPLSDIPLAGVLRSPMFQVSDNSLFWMSDFLKGRSEGKKERPLVEAVKRIDEIESIPEDEKQKIRFFHGLAGELLAIKDRLKINELLDLILMRTSYELTVLADLEGTRRLANLKKLVNLAREFESFEPLSLGNFLRTVKRLESQEVRESEAQIEAEESGHVVRLLSIHRAKGLEFDVVFVSDMGRSRQALESRTFLAKVGEGYAFEVRNELTLEMEQPFVWKRIYEKIFRQDREEWKRLLYVAMTRAKKRLALTGVFKEKKNEKDSFDEMSSWMEWLSRLEEDLEGIEIKKSGKAKPAGRKALPSGERFLEVFPGFEPVERKKLLPKKNLQEEVIPAAEDIFRSLETKPVVSARSIDLPVSAYAAFRKSPEHYLRVYEVGYPDEPEGDGTVETKENEEEAVAADFGTAMHRVLERLDFKHPQGTENELIEECFCSFSKEQKQEAKGYLRAFLQSPLFEELRRAKVVRKEIPFLLNERHGLIHGVIDVLFQDEKNKWHLIDYKTAVGDEKKVKDSGYEVQMEIYAYALGTLLGVWPASARLVFLKNQWTCPIHLSREKVFELEKKIQGMQEEILLLRNQEASNVESSIGQE